ncbi:hypothetical protein N7280_03005 [Rickettsia rhipicephali]|nr:MULTISPECIES: hypothetical protein [spotted fever group]MCX4079606.1 hypothetical protein [Rickettsia rhipicephali]
MTYKLPLEVYFARSLI